jgi:hypothetical protein
MSVKSGKLGTITISGVEETPVGNWTCDRMANLDEYAANDTGGWTKRKAGVKDASWTWDMVDKPSVDEGDEVTIVGYDGTENITTQDVVIETIKEVVDVNKGTIIKYNVTAKGNGPLVSSTGSAP